MATPFKNDAVSALQQISSRRLLAAMSSEARRDRAKPKTAKGFAPNDAPSSPSLDTLLREAEQAVDSSGNLGLTVAFEHVKILDAQAGGFDWGRGEVYVITSILDGSGAQPDFKTHLFQGIEDGDSLPLGQGGMLVGFLKNPRWFVDLHMVIMESDDDIRKIGQSIEEARKQSGLSDLVRGVGAVAAFDPTMITKVVTAVDAFLVALSGILAANGDDHIATVHDFYLKHQGFGVGRHPASGLQKFQDAEVAYRFDLVEI
jgi:hypothetical protein